MENKFTSPLGDFPKRDEGREVRTGEDLEDEFGMEAEQRWEAGVSSHSGFHFRFFKLQ